MWRHVIAYLAVMPGSFLLAATIAAFVGMLSNVAWLLLSNRVLRKITAEEIRQLHDRYRVAMHIGVHGVAVKSTRGQEPKPVLPLLVSYPTANAVPVLLDVFPRMIGHVRRVTIDALRQQNSGRSCECASASMLLDGLWAERKKPSCRQCLLLIAEDCVSEWRNLEHFGKYHQASTSFEMNALEYAARKLCCLTDLEEIVSVR